MFFSSQLFISYKFHKDIQKYYYLLREIKGKQKWATYLVFLSWSRSFFSISASVRVSRYGPQLSTSVPDLMGVSMVGKGASLKAYVFECQLSWPRMLYAMAVANSPPSPKSEHKLSANCSGELSVSDKSHSN